MTSLKFFNPRRWLFGRHRRNPLVGMLARQCAKVTLAYDNNDYYMYRNGERMVVAHLAATLWTDRRPVVLDVGANDGEWALMALALQRDMALHAFEIVPETHGVLRANLQACLDAEPRPVLNAFGLFRDEREIEVWSNYGSNSAGVMPHPDAEDNACIRAKVTTGDAYLASVGTDRIDYLKIDVEGAEYDVLLGFADALAAGRVALLQFEYGPYNIPARRLLIDFYELLGDHGYTVGKIYPGHVEFGPYATALETLRPGNFLAAAPGIDTAFLSG